MREAQVCFDFQFNIHILNVQLLLNYIEAKFVNFHPLIHRIDFVCVHFISHKHACNLLRIAHTHIYIHIYTYIFIYNRILFRLKIGNVILVFKLTSFIEQYNSRFQLLELTTIK
jgi:hypothetical protein